MNLENAPVSWLLEQMLYPQAERAVGQRCRIVHLKSDRGRTLNGRVCVVTGYDRNKEARFHCKVEDTNEIVKLKQSNVMPLQNYNPAIESFMENSPPIPIQTLASCLQRAIKKHNERLPDRPDLMHRVKLYKKLLKKIRDRKATLEEADFCLPCGAGIELFDEDDKLALFLRASRPACYGGDEMCHLRHIDIGLKGDDTTECSVCQQCLSSDTSIVLVTLPCLHVFHKECILNWLGSDIGTTSWNCPTCRATVPGDMSTFCIQYEEQLQRRIDEYPVSGFCAKCMIMIMENNRNETLAGMTTD